MSRYIDIKAFDDWNDDGYNLYAYYEALHNAPSIDIVRCGECKYKDQCHKVVEHTTRDWTSITIAYKPIDYCSYGEREDE